MMKMNSQIVGDRLPVSGLKLQWQLVLTTALILTFSPKEKGQRLYAPLYTIMCRANPVAGAFWFGSAMRELVGGNLTSKGHVFLGNAPIFESVHLNRGS